MPCRMQAALPEVHGQCRLQNGQSSANATVDNVDGIYRLAFDWTARHHRLRDGSRENQFLPPLTGRPARRVYSLAKKPPKNTSGSTVKKCTVCVHLYVTSITMTKDSWRYSRISARLVAAPFRASHRSYCVSGATKRCGSGDPH